MLIYGCEVHFREIPEQNARTTVCDYLFHARPAFSESTRAGLRSEIADRLISDLTSKKRCMQYLVTQVLMRTWFCNRHRLVEKLQHFAKSLSGPCRERKKSLLDLAVDATCQHIRHVTSPGAAQHFTYLYGTQ